MQSIGLKLMLAVPNAQPVVQPRHARARTNEPAPMSPHANATKRRMRTQPLGAITAPPQPLSPRANATKRRIRTSALGAITAPPQPIGNHGSSTLTSNSSSPPQPMSPRANATKRRIRTSVFGAISAPPQPMSPAALCDSSDAFAVMMVIAQHSVHRQLHTLYPVCARVLQSKTSNSTEPHLVQQLGAAFRRTVQK